MVAVSESTVKTADRPRKPTGRKRISYPALLLSQNKHRFYFATIPVDNLFPSCFVASRDEDPIAGFQRALNEARANDIAKYLAAGSGSIPSNIVLSAQVAAEFRYERKSKSLSFNSEPKAFLVLDGQHRLWGYQKCIERHRVPVAIYEGLTRAEEAKLFIDINTTQRGVPAALLLDIKHLAHLESTKETTLRDLFDRLNEDPKSPLAGKLSASQSITGKISRVTFNRAVGRLLANGALRDTEQENRYLLLRNFLNAFESELREKGLLTRSAFFEAACEVFDIVVQRTIALKKNVKQESMQTIVSPLAKLNYQGSGTRALLDKTSIVSTMQSALSATTSISKDMLWVLPQAAVWQQFRKSALDAIQHGSAVSYPDPPTLEGWLNNGSYTVSATSGRGFTLIGSSTEIGSVLLSEALLSGDRALEHSISLRNQLACRRWSSPAWTSVTFYYWTYHLAVALTRLLGRTIWFVTDEIADQLHLLAGTAKKNGGAGPYVVECSTILSATAREIIIRRSKQTRAHDAIWIIWHAKLREITQTVAKQKSPHPETRFYLALLAAANALGDTWPSDLRNAVNYTQAAGYGAV